LALRGEAKRLLWMTFVEFVPELVRKGLATRPDCDRIARELEPLADDTTTLLGFPLLVQVGGKR